MLHKSFPAMITKIDNEAGTVEAIVSVMGNTDHGKDKIWNGAFTKSIHESLQKIRVLDNHQNNSVLNVVGKPLEMRELSKTELPQELLLKHPSATGGLYTKTQYLLDTPEGLGVFKRIQAGAIDEYSIGFYLVKGKHDYSNEKQSDGTQSTVRNIREVVLKEYSPVIWGMNDATMTTDVKKLTVKELSLDKFIRDCELAFRNLYQIEIDEGSSTYTTSRYYVKEVYTNHIIVGSWYEELEYPCYYVSYSYNAGDNTFAFDSQDKWVGGSYKFVAGTKTAETNYEIKEGRMISTANVNKLKECSNALKMGGSLIDEILLMAGAMGESDEEMPMMNDDIDKSNYNFNNSQNTANPNLETDLVTDLEKHRKQNLELIRYLKERK